MPGRADDRACIMVAGADSTHYLVVIGFVLITATTSSYTGNIFIEL